MKGLKILAVAAALLAIAVALWYFASPLVKNRTVNEDLPPELQDMQGKEDTQVDETMPTEASGEEEAFLTGMFRDADNFHKGSGLAEIYILESGERLLRLEDFEVTNGPELHVLLAENPNPEDSESLGSYVDLGRLKGNKGSQNYEIPADLDVMKYASVVIYCKPFHVVFSTAALD